MSVDDQLAELAGTVRDLRAELRALRASAIVGLDAVVLDGGRVLEVRGMYGDGRCDLMRLTLAVPLDVGVYSPHRRYQAGDGVTHDGQWWLCQHDEPGVPGESKGWRLVVRKGRDGRCVCKRGTAEPIGPMR